MIHPHQHWGCVFASYWLVGTAICSGQHRSQKNISIVDCCAVLWCLSDFRLGYPSVSFVVVMQGRGHLLPVHHIFQCCLLIFPCQRFLLLLADENRVGHPGSIHCCPHLCCVVLCHVLPYFLAAISTAILLGH